MLEATDQPGNDMEYAKGSTQGGFIYAPSPNKDRLGEGSSPAGEIVESLWAARAPLPRSTLAWAPTTSRS